MKTEKHMLHLAVFVCVDENEFIHVQREPWDIYSN